MMTDVEFDRNQAAMAFAAMANAFGWQIGFQWIVDDEGKDTQTVLLFVDTPWGVFRWELSPHEMIGQWKEYTGRIPDEHNPNLRRIRISEMIKALTAVKKEEPKIEESTEQVVPQSPENIPADAPKVDEYVPTPEEQAAAEKRRNKLLAQSRKGGIKRNKKKSNDK
jgi:hypothetical protein